MFIFRKARSPTKTLNDLDAYLSGLDDEPIKWLAREVSGWGNEFSYAELEAVIQSGQLDALIDWQGRYSKVVNETFTPIWTAAMVAAAAKATRGMTVLSDSDWYVQSWINNRGGELISQLSDESRRAIMNIILRGQELHMAPRDVAKQIRPIIGLNARQAEANVNYRDKVYQQFRDNGLSHTAAAARADKAAIKYAGKQHRYRAETIVLTENAFAYNRGAHLGVSQSIANGYMGRCEMVWTTAGTNRVCSRCLTLKDTVVGHTDESGVTLPPLHPRCRCAIMYREVDTPKGALKLPRQQHFSSSDDNVKATNPSFSTGMAFQMNCQKCVPTYEMRMRGYDVVARPTFDINTDGFAQDYWDKAFVGAIWEGNLANSGKEQVINLMKGWGNGARGEIFIEWETGGAHVFVAENRNGEIHFLDPQTGELDVEYYFGIVKDGLTKLLRIDNLELNEKYIKWCCKETK